MIPDATMGKSERNVIGVPVAIYREMSHPQKNSHSNTTHTNLNITAPFIIQSILESQS